MAFGEGATQRRQNNSPSCLATSQLHITSSRPPTSPFTTRHTRIDIHSTALPPLAASPCSHVLHTSAPHLRTAAGAPTAPPPGNDGLTHATAPLTLRLDEEGELADCISISTATRTRLPSPCAGQPGHRLRLTLLGDCSPHDSSHTLKARRGMS